MTINVKLRFISGSGSGNGEFEHLLDIGSNIIGRGSPHFINDSHISRKHAEIVVSKELGQATYVQLGQNQGKLARIVVDELTGENLVNNVKITKGLSLVLKNNDQIALYENGIVLKVIIEDDLMEPMQTSIDDDCATQVDSFDLEHNNNLLLEENDNPNNISNDKDDITAAIDVNNNNTLVSKNQLKKARRHSPTNTTGVNDNINTTTTNTTNTTGQSLKRDRNSEDNVDYSIKKSKAVHLASSPVFVEDDTRINLQEDELVYIKRLGHGSCGEVSLYDWRGTQVAVKIIFRSLIHKEKNGEFEKETAILKCLRHPNVVLFMGTCLLKGNLAIITEYLNRGSLRHVLNAKTSISWNIKVKMCLDIAQGMNYLHTYNPKIIHRDLKSVNLLVDNNYNVKVSDFGLSRFTNGNDRAKTFCGTLPWIAPEVFGGGGYSTKADIFSFGIVLWEILTHKTPTENVSNTESGLPEIPPNCPIPYAQLIKECCSKNPENRPTFQQIIGKLKSMFVINPNESDDSSVNRNVDNNSNGNNSGNSSNGSNNGSEENDAIKLEKQSLFNWRIEPSEITEMCFIANTENYILYSGIYTKDQQRQRVHIKQMQATASALLDFEKKELDILANLHSPFIYKFYGVVYNNANEYAIVSEYTPNSSLLSAMKDKTQSFTWERTIDLALQIAKSINELHHFNPIILHRGITSESFVFDKDNQIKITDFGHSRFKLHENMVSLGQIKGKFIYSPPELYSSIKYSTKSDVYSFSIVLWELIQRCITSDYQTPFSNLKLDYDFQIIHQTSKFKKRPIVDEINTPHLLVQLLKQCWDHNPEDRPDFDKIITTLESVKSKL